MLVTLAEQMKDCHHLLIFEGILFRRKLELRVVVGVILFCHELSQHVLDVVQGLLWSLRSLLMCLHAMMEVITIIVISHIS